jgi:EF-hand domain
MHGEGGESERSARVQETAEFQEHYAHTVVFRMLYTLDRTEKGVLTLADLKRGGLAMAMAQLDREEDINKVLRFFSYEHFYVMYCKVRATPHARALARCAPQAPHLLRPLLMHALLAHTASSVHEPRVRTHQRAHQAATVSLHHGCQGGPACAVLLHHGCQGGPAFVVCHSATLPSPGGPHCEEAPMCWWGTVHEALFARQLGPSCMHSCVHLSCALHALEPCVHFMCALHARGRALTARGSPACSSGSSTRTTTL